MHPGLLGKLFGADGRWNGPCTVILDADAHVQAVGSDSIVQGGMKSYAPRLITGRIVANHVRWLAESGSLLVVQQHVIRQHSGEDIHNNTLYVVDAGHVAAVEFGDLKALAMLGVPEPA
jgi:hypothetical protein